MQCIALVLWIKFNSKHVESEMRTQNTENRTQWDAWTQRTCLCMTTKVMLMLWSFHCYALQSHHHRCRFIQTHQIHSNAYNTMVLPTKKLYLRISNDEKAFFIIRKRNSHSFIIILFCISFAWATDQLNTAQHNSYVKLKKEDKNK